METKRKLQFGAAAVIINGLVALGSMVSNPALATSCPDQSAGCACNNGFFTQGATQICENEAPAGCTFLSGTCTSTICAQLPTVVFTIATCHYH
jgi:hypothetical protein